MEKKVQILLVEDELIIADYMHQCLHNAGYEVCGTCINYEEAVEALGNRRPDLILVDISLKGNKTGIDLGNYLKANHKIPFVFATSHSDRATIDAAKQALPYAYLIKPFSEEDLYAVVEMALMHYGRQQQQDATAEDNPILINDGFFIKHKSKFIKLPLSELLYAEANDNYVAMVTTDAKYVLKTTLKNLLDTLPDYFWQIHRSYIINLRHLNAFDMEEVTINGKALPVGRSYYPLLLDRIKIVRG
jgi:two-component system, LytTR family, response regulator LytT